MPWISYAIATPSRTGMPPLKPTEVVISLATVAGVPAYSLVMMCAVCQGAYVYP